MGKSHLLIALFIAGIIFQANAVSLDGSYPREPGAEKDAIKKAEALDPMGNSKPTKKLPDQTFEGKKYSSIRLEGGLQLHPSCELEGSRLGFKAEDFRKRMNEMMGIMMNKLIKCIENYPEMKGYLLESIAQYRRQTLRCDPPKGKKGLIERNGDDYDAYNDSSSITLSNEWLDRVAKGPESDQDTALSTVFHELLHSTKCNNRHDHNKIERIPASVYDSNSKDNKTCSNNVTMDRVSVVESLCMGDTLNSSDKTAAIILADRMNMCGSDRGCRDMFSAKGNNFSFWGDLFGTNIPNKDLDDDASTRLCQRIKDDGMCLHFRNTQGPTITGSNPKVKAVRERMQQRLSEIMPGISNKLSTDWIAIYPDLNKRFMAIKDGNCFKRNFYIPKDRPYEINAFRTEARTVSENGWKYNSNGISDRVGSIAKDLDAFLAKSKSDDCEKDNQEVKSLLSDLEQRLDKGNASITLRHMFNMIDKTEYPEFDSLKNPNSDARKILGQELVKEYLDTMDKYHYQSPKFDCVASGLAPFRVIEAAEKKSNPVCD